MNTRDLPAIRATLSPAELARLSVVRRRRQIEADLAIYQRLCFTRWLVQQGRMSA